MHSDASTNIDFLKKEVERFSEARGWGPYHNPKDVAQSISIEAAELLELFQWRSPAYHPGEKELERVREEMADIMIYLFSLSNTLDMDLTESILGKLRKNEEKYPVEKEKESKKRYDKLVRDKIPDIIREQGRVPETRIAQEHEIKDYILKKISEEVEELRSGRDVEEAVDILEAIRALLKIEGRGFEEIEKKMLEKREERGGFDKRIILVEG